MTGSLDGAPLDHGGCFVWYKLPFPQCRGVQAYCTAGQHIEGTFFHLAPEMRNFPSSLHLFRYLKTRHRKLFWQWCHAVQELRHMIWGLAGWNGCDASLDVTRTILAVQKEVRRRRLVTYGDQGTKRVKQQWNSGWGLGDAFWTSLS